MKKLYYFLTLVFPTILLAQSYTPDATFSDDGVASFQELPSVTPTAYANVTEISGNYFSAYDRAIVKISDTGLLLASSEVSATLPDGTYFTFLNTKYENNAIYRLGFTSLAGIQKDAVIVKLNLDLEPVASFGNNGVAIIDLGQREEITDFVLDQSGNLFCSGTRRESLYGNSSVIAFKVSDQDGTLLQLNGSDFREYIFHDPSGNGQEKSEKGYIGRYNGNYLLAGRNYSPSKLLTVAIDENGELLSGYGTNGYALQTVNYSFTAELPTIINILFQDGKLYTHFNYQPGFATLSTVCIYDIATNTTNVISSGYSYNSMKIHNDRLYLTANSHYIPNHPFLIERRTLTGEPDTTFANGGTLAFSETEPYTSATAVCIDSQDKLVFTGQGPGVSPGSSISEFIAVRMNPGELGLESRLQQGPVISPNPFDDHLSILISEEIAGLKIFDLAGRQLDSPRFVQTDDTVNVDMTGVSQSGLHLLEITTATTRTATRISRR